MAILRVALVTPLTGPLARFGRAGSTALDVWARQAARLPAGWRGVKLEVHDAHPNPAQAMSASTASHPDVVFGPYGSSPAVAAAAATDRLVWNHGGATSQLARPRFPRVVNVPSPASTYFRGSLQAVRAADPDARTVALLHGETGFARDVAGGARAAATALAFEVRAVGFPPGQAADAAAQLPDAEVLLVVGGFEDEIAAARVLLGRGGRGARVPGGAGVRRRRAERAVPAGRGDHRRRRAARRRRGAVMPDAVRRLPPRPRDRPAGRPPGAHGAVAGREPPRRLASGAGGAATPVPAQSIDARPCMKTPLWIRNERSMLPAATAAWPVSPRCAMNDSMASCMARRPLMLIFLSPSLVVRKQLATSSSGACPVSSQKAPSSSRQRRRPASVSYPVRDSQRCTAAERISSVPEPLLIPAARTSARASAPPAGARAAVRAAGSFPRV